MTAIGGLFIKFGFNLECHRRSHPTECLLAAKYSRAKDFCQLPCRQKQKPHQNQTTQKESLRYQKTHGRSANL